jgi:hypothetical protein
MLGKHFKAYFYTGEIRIKNDFLSILMEKSQIPKYQDPDHSSVASLRVAEINFLVLPGTIICQCFLF